jgi:hypothetical protein
MKTKQLAAFSAVSTISMIVGTFVPVPALAAPAMIPPAPIGTLSAFPTIVQTGTKPTLTWNILYPSVVSDLATITPPGTITITKKNTYVSVQPIGTGITACDASQGTTPLKVDARMSVNGASYSQLFYGVQADVNSAYSLYIKKLGVGAYLNFSGRYVKKDGTWSSLFTTKSTNFQVVTLVNGDTIPTSLPLYQTSNLASHLRPYIDSTGKIKIGALSAIVLMELGQTNRDFSCFDYQDMVLLVTFSTRHPNNGHGNNLDGVDSSNPGNGHGGPNGMVDPSAGIDDEIK